LVLLEDKIQLSILRGDFDDLPNSGKPLEKHQNPLIDRLVRSTWASSSAEASSSIRATDLGYELLRKNGVKPEWVELQQTMNALKDDLRSRIRHSWALYAISVDKERRKNMQLANDEDQVAAFQMPDEHHHGRFSASCSQRLQDDLKMCNGVIDTYNLQVPSYLLTRGRLSLDDEIARCMRETTFSSIDEAMTVVKDCEAIFEQMLMQKNLARMNGFGDRDRGRTRSKRWQDDRGDRPSYDKSQTRSSTSMSWYCKEKRDHSQTQTALAFENNLLDKLLDSLVAVVEKPGNFLASYMTRWL
jgi:hypothetical protein